MFKRFYQLCKFRLIILALNVMILSIASDYSIWFFICIYCSGVIILFLTYDRLIEEDGSDKVENTTKKEFLKIFLINFLIYFMIMFFGAIFGKQFHSIKIYLILLCFLAVFSVVIAFFRVRKKRKREQK